MPRNPVYDILFEPVPIGPVTAPNRFYQTPHATGMGHLKPRSVAALRGIKAEGGWGVVCTEYCSIHPSSDDSPYAFLTLWDEEDVRGLALTADAIHAHGSLAAIELWHGGSHSNNRLTREPLLAPSARAARYIQPASARAMDKADIKAFRGWHRAAALRAERAGFDIVYVYAGHDYLPLQFLSPRTNQRVDEYGGPLANRARLLRELIEDTKEAVGAHCAVAVRLAVDELAGPHGITSAGEGREVVAMLAELPDLWDVNVAGGLGNDSLSSRFGEEGFQEEHVAFVKSLTTKPVVSVGRFTSPDRMVRQIKRGIQDFIGAARPSIADPFLPRKIDEGREDEIRECIGCNICRAANNEGVPLRCTQNPTMGEEWRRGWHPERIAGRHAAEKVLIVGAGPAGLEAALALGKRGYEVMLAEARDVPGGRVTREASLPGLSAWLRVRDHRLHMLSKLPNVEIFPASTMTAADVLEAGVQHVAVATGSRWRRDGIGAFVDEPLTMADVPLTLTPDDWFEGAAAKGRVIIYDDDHYALAGALAERLRKDGHEVVLATPAPVVSSWAAMTDEQAMIQSRLMALGVELVLSHRLVSRQTGGATFACGYTERWREIGCDTLMLVTGRIAEAGLYESLTAGGLDLAMHGITSVARVGDCQAPAAIADAVYRGHLYARQLGVAATELAPPRERPMIEEGAARHDR